MEIKLLFVPEYIFKSRTDIVKSLCFYGKNYPYIFNNDPEGKEDTITKLSKGELIDISVMSHYMQWYLAGNHFSLSMEMDIRNQSRTVGFHDEDFSRVITENEVFKPLLIDMMTGDVKSIPPCIKNLEFKVEELMNEKKDSVKYYILKVDESLAKYLYLHQDLEDKMVLFEKIIVYLKRMETADTVYDSPVFLDYLIRLKELNKRGLPKEKRITLAVGI